MARRPSPEHLTTTQAAEHLGVDPATVRQQIANGRIAATKMGRDWLISRSEVERYRGESLGRPGRRA